MVTIGGVADLPTGMGAIATHQIVLAFLAWMQARNMSENTIRRRAISISAFARFIQPGTIEVASATDVEDWLSTKRAPSTRHAYRSDLATFYAWAVRRRHLERNPVAETDSVIVPKGLPKPIDGSDLHRAIAVAEPRVRLALILASCASLRCAEIAALTTADIHGAHLFVRGGKGGRDRSVPLHPAVVAELRRWKLPHGARFIDVSPDRLGRLVSAHLRACGIDATLHCGRHSFGTELARISHDIMLVQQLMGHSNPATTMGYVRLNAPGGAEVAEMWQLGA